MPRDPAPPAAQPPVGLAPAARRSAARRWARRARWLALAFPLLATGALALYVWAALSFSYSSGERAGYVQKFSRRGWICKTWEGQLAVVTLPGATPEIFLFTVREDGVAAEVNRLMGQRVVLSYEQHLGVPTRCFGDTDYFVVKVRPVVEP